MVESSSASMTAQSAELPGSIAAATPGSMLAPTRLHSTVPPAASMAEAMTLLVVVLPLVPHVTMAPWLSLPERSAMTFGSMDSATRPGSWDALRCATLRNPHETNEPRPLASEVLTAMRYFSTSSSSRSRRPSSYSSGVSTSSMRRLTPATSRPVMPTICLTTTFLTSSKICGA